MKLLSYILFAFLLTGCSINRSHVVDYPGIRTIGEVVNTSDKVVMLSWQDSRIEALSGSKSQEKYIFPIGDYGIGMSYKGADFVRIADFVKDRMAEEMQSQGVNLVNLNFSINNYDNQELLKKIANQNNAKYIILGNLLFYKWECVKECYTRVTYEISLFDANGKFLLDKQRFDHFDKADAIFTDKIVRNISSVTLPAVLEKTIPKLIFEINKK